MGRPKGAKDKAPRKRKGEQPPIVNPGVPASDKEPPKPVAPPPPNRNVSIGPSLMRARVVEPVGEDSQESTLDVNGNLPVGVMFSADVPGPAWLDYLDQDGKRRKIAYTVGLVAEDFHGQLLDHPFLSTPLYCLRVARVYKKGTTAKRIVVLYQGPQGSATEVTHAGTTTSAGAENRQETIQATAA